MGLHEVRIDAILLVEIGPHDAKVHGIGVLRLENVDHLVVEECVSESGPVVWQESLD